MPSAQAGHTGDDVAERIVHLHGYLGHMRHFLQSDVGGLPHMCPEPSIGSTGSGRWLPSVVRPRTLSP